MPPDLPPNYYLDNVKILFSHIESTYSDILDENLADFITHFNKLNESAQRLAVRLLNRRHLNFRQSKLNYPEIESIESALQELESAGFLSLNDAIDPTDFLRLFTKNELLAVIDDSSTFKHQRREVLDSALLEPESADKIERLKTIETIIILLVQEQYTICQMIFFGNLNQSMTDFVLRDLGLYQYENYRIDKNNRPFQSQLEIQQRWLLYQLQTLLDLTDSNDSESLIECFYCIPDDIVSTSNQFQLADRLRFSIARQVERNSDVEKASKLYQQCQLPPARERQVRILTAQQNYDEALSLCETILTNPFDESESQFSQEFASRLIRQRKLPARERFNPSTNPHPIKPITLILPQSDHVELAVVEHYQSIDSRGLCQYVENSLFSGVLGLLIWDAIFDSIPGAFYHPFQHRPADFYHHDFMANRKPIFDRLWQQIDRPELMRSLLHQSWESHHGILNPMVNWGALDLETINLAVERIDPNHWLAIFKRILSDLRNNRTGFPDLVYFPSTGGYQLVEVKGPGDQLQKNQKRWMTYFDLHQIPYQVARVKWQ
ncbi:MAG: hypothetical protein ACI845_002881 [Gammaproteobacteria bacterium]|jgi:hypothetical protein